MSDDRPAPIRATYRFQVTPQDPLPAVTAAVPYLDRLGVSHVYTSPLLQAAPGSQHGYDVIDHSLVNTELGGDEALDELHRTLAAHGMGHVLDIVPNHMAVGDPHNRWWWDVLQHGPESRYAHHFDIDWDPETSSLTDRVLVPVLGVRLGEALAERQITVERDGDDFVVRYFDHVFPVRPSTYRLAAAALGGAPERLHDLLDRQYYRLAWWRTAAEEIDYRRFFDVTTLAGLRVEDPDVFAAVHRLALEWVGEGTVQGLRVDHPDGLRNPRAYFEQLRAAAPGTWIVAEKILEHGEDLRESWPVDGTTGYDFAALATGVLVDAEAEPAFDELERRFAGGGVPYEQMVKDAKREVVESAFGAEIDRLAASLVRMAAASLELRDLPRAMLRTAVVELLVAMPVYRTYIELPAYHPGQLDLDVVEHARQAALAEGVADHYAVDAVASVLRGEVPVAGSANFVARFQQTSGPVMAKGIEDTVMYRYVRLLALNEVGSDPARFGRPIEELHAANLERRARWPRAMLTLSTHDTKRSEDVRARLAVLSEVPDEWERFLGRWYELAARHRTQLASGPAPEPATEYVVAQTLVGAWPLAQDRLDGYLEKAMREAKQRTSWTDPDDDYEQAVHCYAAGVLADDDMRRLLDDLLARVLPAGRTNSLAQKLLELTSPGIPDVYQGCEVWSDTLVDPDNRRPIDHGELAALLDRLEAGTESGRTPAAAALELFGAGGPKLLVVREALAVRGRLPQCFDDSEQASYTPFDAGPFAVAYARGSDVVVVVPRLTLRREAAGGFGDAAIELPEGRWRDRFTGELHVGGSRSVATLLAGFPVALLMREG